MKAIARVCLPLFGLGLLLLALPGPALALGPVNTDLELLFPPEPVVGQELALAARVRDPSGAGVPGVEVVFTTTATFLNAESELELGRAVTDERGITTFSYLPRSEGEITVSALFAGNDQYRKRAASGQMVVLPGLPQYHQEIGLRVPGVGVWLLVALMAGIWGTFLWALGQVRVIFREGQEVASSEWGRRHV
ncbi:MAG: hypothetical protein HYX99_00710, partial [Chloroflexi bacterium]|nr:hypothetical protein [Chloroflexota bacterium]